MKSFTVLEDHFFETLQKMGLEIFVHKTKKATQRILVCVRYSESVNWSFENPHGWSLYVYKGQRAVIEDITQLRIQVWDLGERDVMSFRSGEPFIDTRLVIRVHLQGGVDRITASANSFLKKITEVTLIGSG